jgi:hypothetical protein
MIPKGYQERISKTHILDGVATCYPNIYGWSHRNMKEKQTPRFIQSG